MNVLVPFDVKPVSERAVDTAIELFSDQEDVHILAVHFSRGEDQPAEIAAQRIESMGAKHDVVVEADINVVGHDVDSKTAVRTEIAEFIAKNDVDLVVLGHEEKSLFEEIFHSDTSERLLEVQEIPVLLVP